MDIKTSFTHRFLFRSHFFTIKMSFFHLATRKMFYSEFFFNQMANFSLFLGCTFHFFWLWLIKIEIISVLLPSRVCVCIEKKRKRLIRRTNYKHSEISAIGWLVCVFGFRPPKKIMLYWIFVFFSHLCCNMFSRWVCVCVQCIVCI